MRAFKSRSEQMYDEVKKHHLVLPDGVLKPFLILYLFVFEWI